MGKIVRKEDGVFVELSPAEILDLDVPIKNGPPVKLREFLTHAALLKLKSSQKFGNAKTRETKANFANGIFRVGFR